ncbi:MAG TPA: hypothetical protein VK203_18375 [Nostocaceae cyanobacterium]|nr:hypothetical protein [Nostocaceae cyanobacterium]
MAGDQVQIIAVFNHCEVDKFSLQACLLTSANRFPDSHKTAIDRQ